MYHNIQGRGIYRKSYQPQRNHIQLKAVMKRLMQLQKLFITIVHFCNFRLKLTNICKRGKFNI